MLRKNPFSRGRLREFLRKDNFHKTIIGLVVFDLILVFTDLALAFTISCTPIIHKDAHHRRAEPVVSDKSTLPACTPIILPTHEIELTKLVLLWTSVSILCLFCIEILTSLYAFGLRHFKSLLNAVDAVIVFASLFLELYFHLSGLEHANPGVLVILRIWKIVRAIHAIAHSIQLKNNQVIEKIKKVNEKIQQEELQIRKLFHLKKIELRAITRTLKEEHGTPPILEMVAELNEIFEVLDKGLAKEEGAVESAIIEALKKVRDPDFDPEEIETLRGVDLEKNEEAVGSENVVKERKWWWKKGRVPVEKC